MCGRYAIAPARTDAWATAGSVLGAALAAELAALQPRYNVAPSTQVPIVVHDSASGRFRALAARWGMIPHWWPQAKLPTHSINARAEEAAAKPMWRDAYRGGRCLVPATHWYEWRQEAATRVPHALATPEGEGFMFAGLWATWSPPGSAPIVSAAILTRAASDAVKAVHDRMPVILHPRAWTRWLDPSVTNPADVAEILAVNAVLEAKIWRVSTFVNKPVNDAAECLAPAQ